MSLMTADGVAARLDAATKRYGATAALSQVDLQVAQGRITALLGPNGAGKTTAVRLDEPTVGLDVASRRALWTSIQRLAEQGRAVLLTTHYLEEAEALAQHVIILARGRIVAEGSPAQIRARETRRRVRFRSTLPAERIRALLPGEPVHMDGDVIELFTGEVEDTLRVLLVDDPTLRDLEVAATGLESAFLALTRDRAGAAADPAVPVGP